MHDLVSRTVLFCLCLVWTAGGLPLRGQGPPSLDVRTDFEGGSVCVLRVDPHTREVEFMPGGDPRRGWPCWWFFRVDGLGAGETLTLRLRGSDATVSGPGQVLSKPLSAGWAMPGQASFSRDGETWAQTEKGVREEEWMVYRVAPAEGGSVWVAWGPPYTPGRAQRFLDEIGRNRPGVEVGELCRSREGRPVPWMRVCEGGKPTGARFGVWVQARQHAWESGSSWVAQGFAEWLLGESQEARWVRENAEIFLVPVMDVDNVATGNGGKDALPHDHNRDWSDQPHWRETEAAQKRVRALIAEGRMDVFLDLHNPGPQDPTFFFSLSPDQLPEARRRLPERFLQIGYAHISKGALFVPMSNRPKYTGPDYHPLWRHMSANWVAMNGNPQTVGLCLETIWNASSGTTEGYRAVGTRLGGALREFLGEQPARP